MRIRFIALAAALATAGAALLYLFISLNEYRQTPSAIAGRAEAVEANAKDAPGSVALRYSFADGQTREWRILTRTEVAFEKPGAKGGAPLASLALDGTLALKFFADAKGWKVAGRWRTDTFLINSTPPAWAVELERPFAFELDAAGYATGFTAPGSPKGARLLRRAVAAALPVLPRQPAAEWTVRERDGEGVCRSHYRVAGKSGATVTLAKAKLEYLEAGGEGETPQVLSSRWRFEVDTSEGGALPARADGEDATLAGGEALPGAIARVTTTVTGGGLAIAPIEEGYAAYLAKAAEKVADARAPSAMRNPFAGYTPAKVLGEFAKGWRSDPAGMEAKLKAWLLLTEGGFGRAVAALEEELLQKGDARPKEWLHVWRLIAETGTPEAQRALLDAAANQSLSPLTRMEALGHVALVENPEPFLADGLLSLYRSIPSGGQGDEGVIRSMALLAVGGLGDRTDAVSPEKTRIAGLLRQTLASASEADAPDVLEAIGNTGDPTFAQDVAPWFQSQNPSARAGAYRALRRAQGGAAAGALTARIDAETDPQVRKAAINTLASMTPTESEQGWARIKLADPETGESEKSELVKFLGKYADKPENAAALRAAGAKAQSREMKILVYRYVPPA